MSVMTSWLFTQPFVQAQIKGNIEAPRHSRLWGEFTGDQWIPKGPVTPKMFPFDDVIMHFDALVRRATLLVSDWQCILKFIFSFL